MYFKTLLVTLSVTAIYSTAKAEGNHEAQPMHPRIGLCYRDKFFLTNSADLNKNSIFSFYFTAASENSHPGLHACQLSYPYNRPQKRTANTLMTVGGGLLGCGIGLMAIGINRTNKEFETRAKEGFVESMCGVGVGVAGAGLLLTGGILKITIAARENRGR